ncbi:MAG TPA: MgtC/SapB family protein [Burkholderiales bacterium]|nr:MgtC/SapB family protein [Burkholderiales bacterium]
MEAIDLFERLAAALAIGLLVGIERGWTEREEREGERAAGLRTFALAGLLGGVWGALSAGDGGEIALAVAFLVFSVIVAAFRYRELVREQSYGVTTVVAAMLVFALGALAVIGEIVVAAAAGVATAGLLALKAVLHEWVKRLTWAELRAGLALLAMTLILLPILPDRPMGPWNAVNPRDVWIMTIVIAAVSFVGYVAVRIAGERRGLLISAFAGSVVSSTAVTLDMARLARQHPERTALFSAAAVLAGGTMMARVLLIAGFFNVELLRWLVPPLVLAGLVSLAGAAVVLRRWWQSREERSEAGSALELTNPFDLPTVLKFGALLAVVMFIAEALTRSYGAGGAYVLGAVSGMASLDALTLSMARLAHATLAPESAATSILIGVAVNSVAKGVLAWIAGGAGIGRRVLLFAALAIAAGFVGLQLASLWDPIAFLARITR